MSNFKLDVGFNRKKIEMFFNKQDRFELITVSDNEGSVSSTVLKGFTISLQEIFGE